MKNSDHHMVPPQKHAAHKNGASIADAGDGQGKEPTASAGAACGSPRDGNSRNHDADTGGKDKHRSKNPPGCVVIRRIKLP